LVSRTFDNETAAALGGAAAAVGDFALLVGIALGRFV
jgi:hypothetical protein